MVRTYLMKKTEKKAVKEYLDGVKADSSIPMPSIVRGIRHNLKTKKVDFDQLRKEIDLAEELCNFVVPTGRISKAVKAGFEVRGGKKDQVKAGFKVKDKKSKKGKGGFTVKAPKETE